jgi:hypothetical protein
MGGLSDEILRMVDAFSDQRRQTAVRFLAAKVERLEEVVDVVSALPGTWYQRAAEDDSIRPGVEECADELRVALSELVER